MPLDNGIYFCIKYYLYIIYLLYGWGKLVSSIQVQQGAKITPVPFEAGETLLSALRRAGYSIPAACGGKGRCGKCRVKVNGVPRLACKTKAQDGDWIDLPETMRGVILTDTLTLPKAQAGRSGLGAAVDLVAVLLERGVIDGSGRLLPPQDAPEDMRRYLTEDGQGNGVFHLTKAVSLTARDVRNLQLAKAAVAGGIRVLLEQRGVTADDIASVELAGGFGNYLSPESAVRIGMLPRACLSKIRPLGNAALAGASMLALDGENWRKLAEIPEKCRYLELSGRDDFSRAFTDSLTF